MPKRKRDDTGLSEETPKRSADRALRIQRLQVEGVLSNGTKTLFRALKIARGFERRKLGRRQKTAKAANDDAETKRLEVEVVTLKKLNLTATAELYLYKSLTKVKSVATSPAFPAWVAEKVKVPGEQKEVAYKNVTARLWNSNPVRIALEDVAEGVRGVLGVGKGEEGRRKRVRAKDFEGEGFGNEKEGDGGDEEGVEVRREEEELLSGDGVDKLGDEGVDGEREGVGMDASSDESEDYDQYASRLADSSNDEDSSDEDETQLMDRQRQSSFSPLSPGSLPPTTSHHPKPAKAPKPTTNTFPAPKTTTFLPSLTAAYWSNSDSATSDPDSDAGEIQPRKNRMGQQARRALWEKKFGAKANHIKLQSQSQNRDQGWDARKGAQGGDERGLRGRGKGRGSGGRRRPPNVKGASGANSDPLGERRGKKGEEKEGPLHPSWEAAKKKKEAKVMPAFEGRKIVFD
ncbi:hypothetical protein MMC30_002575 [Trapelia coarctata]|nr:hypothetical protein [Trapelia coarctata]